MEEPSGNVVESTGNIENPSGNVEESTGNVEESSKKSEKSTENVGEQTISSEKPTENFEDQGTREVIENTTNNKSEHDNSFEANDSEKKWPGWPGENVFRILVPSQKVGSIIGRKGEFIKKMCEESRARIKILDGPQGAQERAVMISAKEEHDASFSPAMDGLLKVHRRTLDGLNNDTSNPVPPHNMVFTRLLVPAAQAGSLIGKQGATIKTVQEGSNCTIRILEDVPPIALEDDRVVEIQGEPDGVHKAVELIASHLRKFLVDRSVVQLFEIQMQTPRHPRMEQNIPPSQPWGPPQGPPNMGGNLGYGGNPSYGSNQVYGGNPSYGGNIPGYSNPPPYMPPGRPQDNYAPPAEIPPYEKPPHRGISTYGREAPSPASQQPSSNASQVTQQMQVPLAYADNVIGHAGANISYIRRVSGATVTIQETRGVPGEMTVEINGTATQVQTAQQLVQNYMAEAASASTVATTTVAHNPTMATEQGYNYYQSMYMAPPTAATNDGPPAQPTSGYGSTYGSYGY